GDRRSLPKCGSSRGGVRRPNRLLLARTDQFGGWRSAVCVISASIFRRPATALEGWNGIGGCGRFETDDLREEIDGARTVDCSGLRFEGQWPDEADDRGA